MMKMLLILALPVALLAACAPAGGAEPTPAGPASGVGQSYPSTDAGDAPAPGAEDPPDGYPSGGLISPVEVDLSQLTPVPGDPTPQVAPSPGRPGGSTPAAQAALVEAATRNLSAYLGLPTGAIAVVSVEPATWPDAALGCPEPGAAYAAALVEGSRLTLAADGEQYTYHTDGTSQYVLCIDGERASEGTVPPP